MSGTTETPAEALTDPAIWAGSPRTPATADRGVPPHAVVTTHPLHGLVWITEIWRRLIHPQMNEARLAINRQCWRVARPWIDGAIEVIQGVARVFHPDPAAN